jgi:heme-degrading monooxygenase HmoA
MIIVYVKHFLNAAGIKYYLEDWFPKVKSIIEKQPGYLAITTCQDKLNTSCMRIIVTFETKELLEAWVKTAAHAEVLDKLEPLRTQAWEVVITEDATVDPDTLVWKQIPLKNH